MTGHESDAARAGWMDRAACTTNPDAWTSEHGYELRAAADICNTFCPVRRECARLALTFLRNPAESPILGVWAGVVCAWKTKRSDLITRLQEVATGDSSTGRTVTHVASSRPVYVDDSAMRVSA